jgi:hypothetical protein
VLFLFLEELSSVKLLHLVFFLLNRHLESTKDLLLVFVK